MYVAGARALTHDILPQAGTDVNVIPAVMPRNGVLVLTRGQATPFPPIRGRPSGSLAACPYPVFLTMATERNMLLGEAQRLLLAVPQEFILLTPTLTYWMGGIADSVAGRAVLAALGCRRSTPVAPVSSEALLFSIDQHGTEVGSFSHALLHALIASLVSKLVS